MKTLALACVKAGTSVPAEHVNILKDMITRNISGNVEGRFVCLTDDATGLDPDIEIIPLPRDIKGWWAKLYLFKEGIFKYGERVLYFDVSSLPVGNLDELVRYNGKFATLRDFYRPNGLQSAVMAWPGGWGGHIWSEWERAGRPLLPGGDQEWLERVAHDAEILQDHFPGYFHSYKLNCRGRNRPPTGSRVVKFHGLPKPWHVEDEWVKQLWKIGGGVADDIELCYNTDIHELHAHIRKNSREPLPWLDMKDPREDGCVIVGGGPSATGMLDEIRARHHSRQTIIALNGAAHWLNKHGIVPDWHVLLDGRPENVNFVIGSSARRYFLASQVHPDLFSVLIERDVTVWHSNVEDVEEQLPKVDKPIVLVSSGSTVGLAAMVLAYAQGFREIHLYGMDSSYKDGEHHAYKQPDQDGDVIIDATAGGRTFKSTPWMIAQVNEFQHVASELANGGAAIFAHGDGLLQHVARQMMNTTEVDGYRLVGGYYWPQANEQAKDILESVEDIDEVLAHVPERRVVVQAGGNVGVWPQELASKFGEVVTFEPDETNFDCLQKNVTRGNVRAFRAALGETAGTVGIVRDPANSGANFVSAGDDIPVMRIDDLSLETCDLIALDIEGYELAALKGAAETIKRHKPVVLIEDKGLSERYGVAQGEATTWLSQYGYKPVAHIGRDIILKAA